MSGYADELSVKLTAKDEMSAKLRAANKELQSVARQVQAAQKEFDRTGSPEAAANLKQLSAQWEKLAKAQAEAARSARTANAELKKTQSEAGKATTAMGRLGASITKHATAIRNAGLVAGAAMLLFAKQSISAFAEAEKQQVMLNQAYSRFPKIQDVTRASFDKLNTSIMNLTGTDDDALASAEALLSRFDLTGQQIQQLMPIINDYAIATGQDIGDATKKVGMAMLGNAKALKSMGINYKATGDRAADYSSILEILTTKVGGVGEAFGKTTAGQLAIASQNFENLKESVGVALVPALQAMVNVMRPAVSMFTALPEPVKQTGIGVAALGIAAMVATPRLVAMNGALTGMGLGLGPVAAILLAVITSVKGVNDVATTSTGPVDAFFAAIKSAAPPMLVPTIFAIGEAIGYVNHNLDKTPPSTNAATDAFKKQLRVQVLGTQANEQYADALKAWRKSINDYIKKPSVDAAKAAVRGFTAAAGAFKDGSKAQADFVTKNLPAVENAIKKSGMDKDLQRKLLAPLRRAAAEAIRVQELIDLIHGKKIAITYYGGTPTNSGGYHGKVKPATGGLITGPGTGISDSIPAMISNGEFVIRAAAVKTLGVDTLRALNHADKAPALPPLVSAPRISLPSQSVGRDAPLVGHMEIHTTSQVDVELALAREARRADRDRKARTAGTR